jgi:PAS domain S-box-containing protein
MKNDPAKPLPIEDARPTPPPVVADDKFRRIFQYSTDMISITQIATGRYLDVNDEFVRMSGYSRARIIGRTPEEMGFWQESDESRAFSARLLRDGVVRNHETVATVSGGRRLNILISAVFIEVDGEQCSLGISRDITDLKQAQDDIRKADRRLREVLSNAPVVMTVIDNAGIVTLSDGAGLKPLGLAPDQMIGTSFMEFVGTGSEIARHAREALGGKAQAVVGNFNGRDFDVWYSPVRDSHQRIVGAMSVATDITDRVRVEEELRRREEYYRTLIEASSDLIVVMDAGGIVIFAGGQSLRDIASSPGDLIGHPAAEFEHPEDIAEQARVVAWVFANPGQIVRTQARLRATAGGWIPFEFAGRVISGAGGEPLLVTTGRDFTARLRIESELAAARDAALAASRAKSEFVSSMSHEIRTPMNAILGMADLLWDSELSPEQRRYLATVVSNGNALLELINSVLDLAKVESGRMHLEHAHFDLADLLERVREMFAVRALEKHLKLEIRRAPEVPKFVAGDALRLRQILINLVGNAIKFTERGEIVISVAAAASAGGAAMLEFTVADTGIGLSAAELATVFAPFTQADSSTTRKYGGSGLGLAIVERLAALMGGTVWAESAPGIGSQFHFTARLEAAATAAQCEPAAPNLPAAAPRILDRPLKILLADDSADNRMLVAAYLKKTPYRLAMAENGKVAYDKFVANGADVVLMDIQMPVLDGYGATRMIRNFESQGDRARTPIIALSASALDESVHRSLDAGCDFHVSKPVKRATLLDAIAAAVDPVSARPQAVGGGDTPPRDLE